MSKEEDRKTEQVMQAVLVLPTGQELPATVTVPPPEMLPIRNNQTGQDDMFVFDKYIENVTTGQKFARYRLSPIASGAAIPADSLK